MRINPIFQKKKSLILTSSWFMNICALHEYQLSTNFDYNALQKLIDFEHWNKQTLLIIPNLFLFHPQNRHFFNFHVKSVKITLLEFSAQKFKLKNKFNLYFKIFFPQNEQMNKSNDRGFRQWKSNSGLNKGLQDHQWCRWN